MKSEMAPMALAAESGSGMDERVRYRQIHLDFHTSPTIDGIGSRFDADEFGGRLLAAGVDSINLFAKCHHGMYYYPTKLGTMHPGLSFDLFGAQVSACVSRGIRAMAYTCVAWNEDCADRHPEWLQVDARGVWGLKGPFDDAYYGWRNLCVGNRDYRELLKREIAEIRSLYPSIAGFWVDIVVSKGCVCPRCRAEMAAQGLDPRVPADVARHDRRNEIDFMRDLYAHITSIDPGLMAYFNGFPYEPDQRDDAGLSTSLKRDSMSFVDIESLPSDSWGYAHFPVNVNYLNKYGQELAMMNGKFHLAWGDFGSLRNEEALEYECFRALSHGTKVCIGDQLHPDGRLEPAAYDLVGRVLRSVAEKEPWCRGTTKCRDVAVFVSTPVLGGGPFGAMDSTMEGACRILSELRVPFDFVDFRDPLDGYRIIIIPEGVRLPPDTARRVQGFLDRDGRVIAFADGGLASDSDAYAFGGFCVRHLGQAEYSPRYLRIGEGDLEGVPAMDYVVYQSGSKAFCEAGSRVHARVVNPYFNRSSERFCSHRQTPPANLSEEPAIAFNARSAYVAFPLFRDYATNGLRLYKRIVARVLDEFGGRDLLGAELPSTAEATLRRRKDGFVLHALNYVIQRKCKTLDTIEDRWPLHDVKFSVRTGNCPEAVRLVPSMEPLEFSFGEGMTSFAIPEIAGHQMVHIISKA